MLKKNGDTCVLSFPTLTELNKLDNVDIQYLPPSISSYHTSPMEIITNSAINSDSLKQSSRGPINESSNGSESRSSSSGRTNSILKSSLSSLYRKTNGLLRSFIVMYSWLNFTILYSLLYVLVCLPCKYLFKNDHYHVEVENFIFTTMSYYLLKLFHLQGLRLIECGDDPTHMKHRTRVTFWNQYKQCEMFPSPTLERSFNDNCRIDNEHENVLDFKDQASSVAYDCHMKKSSEKTKAIIMANHTRNIDGLIMQYIANDWIKSNTMFIARGLERFAQIFHLLIAGHGAFFVENRKQKDDQIQKNALRMDKSTSTKNKNCDKDNKPQQTTSSQQQADASSQSLTRCNERPAKTGINQSRQLTRLRQHLLDHKRKNVLFVLPEGGTYEIFVSSKESKMRKAISNDKTAETNVNQEDRLIKKISPYKYLLIPRSGALKQMLHPDIKVTHVVDLTVIWEHQFHKTTSMWKFLTLNFKGDVYLHYKIFKRDEIDLSNFDEWLQKRWEVKDKLLEQFFTNKSNFLASTVEQTKVVPFDHVKLLCVAYCFYTLPISIFYLLSWILTFVGLLLRILIHLILSL